MTGIVLLIALFIVAHEIFFSLNVERIIYLICVFDLFADWIIVVLAFALLRANCRLLLVFSVVLS
jgi:hypothetical protein